MTKYITPTQKAFWYYKSFIAIKFHFTQKSYNIVETKGRVNITEEAFKEKPEVDVFKALAKAYQSQNLFREIVVANILRNPKVHPTFLLSEEAKNIHSKWIAKTDFLYYNFENEIGSLMEIPFDEMFSTDGMNPPLIMKKYIDGSISLETLVILFRYTKLKKIYCDLLKDCFVFQELYHLILKYSYLMNYDMVDMKHIVSKVLKKWVQTQSISK